jgi:hypothetical protein|tara:strand:- start:644 stop:1564 length:921 start_codon:yes stop_codon:yes gene_type:complete
MAEAAEKVIDDNEEVEITVDDTKTLVNSESDHGSITTEVVVSEEDTQDPEELDDYSKRVQKRIKTLTDKYRTEERDREEAVRFAQTVKQENDKLKERLTSLDKGYLNEYGTRLESQLATAKNIYRDAHESGDVDKMFDAQGALSKISIEQERYRLAKQRQDQTKLQKAPTEGGTQVQASAPRAQTPPPKADPKAEGWANKNEWFGQDEVMTYAAFGIHRKLVEEEGFDPQADEYYSEIDKRMRTEFPQRFNAGRKTGGSARVASADTSASRTTKTGRRTVKLSASQIAIAKKLGVPLEEYAKYVKD